MGALQPYHHAQKWGGNRLVVPWEVSTVTGNPARVIVAAILMLLSPAARPNTAAARELTYEDLLAHLTDIDRLPVIEPGVRCLQFSSYDRASQYDAATDSYNNWDANGDAGHFLRIDPQTKEGVMAEMDGPGCIFRIWSANPQGVIRFYLDGDAKPTYEWDFNRLCTGAIEPFIKPLVWKRDPNNANSASNIYLPIPYAKGCKVTSVIPQPDGAGKTPGHYYIINYRTFPKDWTVSTFKLPLTESQRAAVEDTAAKWSRCGQVGAHPLDRFATKKETIAPGQRLVVAELKGPAVIRQFRAKLSSTEKWATRKVGLRIYWDDETEPSVCCPIGDFFGEPKDVEYKSYPMGITDSMNYCFFPMPFRAGAKIDLVNEGKQPAPVEVAIAYRPQEVPDDWAHFKAKFRSEIASESFDYPLIETRGTGKLVGICLFPDNIHGGWWGEGDEKVYVDGEKFPSWFGTGSEDYFGDAWGIRHFANPSHGHPQKNVERMQGCYRWHLGDNIPFYKSLRMTIENYTGLPHVTSRNDYSSVAYWYELPGGNDFFEEVPLADRIPRGFVATGALEIERCQDPATLSDALRVIDDTELPKPLSSGGGLMFVGDVGDEITFQVPVGQDEHYLLRPVLAQDVRNSKFELLVDGKPAGQRPYLRKGMMPITLKFTGDPVDGDRCRAIIDCLRMEVYRNFITHWMVVGPFPNPEHKGFSTVYPPEEQLDFGAKYAGKDNQDLTWQPVSSQDGVMMLQGRFRPSEDVIVYGACIVRSPKVGKRTLLVGSDDGIKIWLNGRVVWEHLVRRGIKPDEDRIEVDLKQGDNLLLLKLDQGPGDMGWAVRFVDPADELQFALPK